MGSRCHQRFTHNSLQSGHLSTHTSSLQAPRAQTSVMSGLGRRPCDCCAFERRSVCGELVVAGRKSCCSVTESFYTGLNNWWLYSDTTSLPPPGRPLPQAQRAAVWPSSVWGEMHPHCRTCFHQLKKPARQLFHLGFFIFLNNPSFSCSKPTAASPWQQPIQ